ncbi:lysine-specific demethylase 5A-like [Mercenaria mercenaria]|uniref:lysine-specific demethylase 5A-like n=1 Tax=Mercenaria mercenaria TaxID=6596 RepID=UPI00234F9801|nr:lysine-specific demethylase 5A-like [Mercenaria mercenaria]
MQKLDDVDQTEQPSTTSTSVPDGNDIEIDFVDEKNEEEFDEEFDSIIEAISQEEDYDEVKIPDNFSIDTVLQSLKYTNVFTESQMKVNHILDNISQFRKDVKGAYKVKKTMAHRKQVKVSECKTDTKKQSKKKKKDAETPSTSTDLAVTIDTPSTSTVSAEIVLCKVCQLDHENDDWIQCDKCNGWFHRVCAGLKNTRWWKKYSAEGANWICKVCKKK